MFRVSEDLYHCNSDQGQQECVGKLWCGQQNSTIFPYHMGHRIEDKLPVCYPTHIMVKTNFVKFLFKMGFPFSYFIFLPSVRTCSCTMPNTGPYAASTLVQNDFYFPAKALDVPRYSITQERTSYFKRGRNITHTQGRC